MFDGEKTANLSHYEWPVGWEGRRPTFIVRSNKWGITLGAICIRYARTISGSFREALKVDLVTSMLIRVTKVDMRSFTVTTAQKD